MENSWERATKDKIDGKVTYRPTHSKIIDFIIVIVVVVVIISLHCEHSRAFIINCC